MEAQLKAKDEEIAKLYSISYRHGYSDAYDASEMCKLGFVKPFERIDKKARSIVAMLFWEWRKAIREDKISYQSSEIGYWYVKAKEESFKEAYNLLKDTK